MKPALRWMRVGILLSAITPLIGSATDEALFVARDYVGDGVFSAGIEGPAVGPDGHLYAVSFEHDGTIGRVRRQADGSGRAELFVALPEGSTGNGIRFDRESHLLVADYSGHNVLRITPAGVVSVFAHEPRMNQPNDIALAPDGRIYASDPNWKDGSGQLWRVDLDGSTHLLEAGMGTTNGVEVSPDGRHLYVNESVQRRVWRYALDAAGGISGKKLIHQFDAHGLDGMRTDAQGRLFIARYDAGTVVVLDPDGRLVREVALKGRKPTNVAFGGEGGRDVFVTLQDRGAIETFRSDIPGRESGR